MFDKWKELTLPNWGVGVLFLFEHLHFTCEAGLAKALILVLGELLCLITPVNKASKTSEVVCKATNGMPEEIVYLNAEGKEVNLGTTALRVSTNEGSEEGAGVLLLRPSK